ncbi:MAG: HD domain-containing phosphohydrolase [Candidatus Gorgyraea atricola]|nr:HD domain-containing phosphohydrolase [Candidatus Gorgyraea atricola]
MKNGTENNSSLYKKPVLTTKEAAKLLKVGVQTIKNYIYQGKIKSFKTPGGHHRILRSDLPAQLEETFMAELKNGTEQLIRTNGAKAAHDTHESYLVIIKALVKALEMRETRDDSHLDFAAKCSLKMAQRLDLPEEEKKNLELAALLRDIGKIGVSEQILGKPGKLTEQEFMVIKEHPKIAERIVSDIEFLEKTKPLVRHHHERMDGSGYPDGLSGKNIPLGARIIAITGVYQALISDRPYRKAYSEEDAKAIIKKSSGSQFDPKLVDLFFEVT